MPVFIVATIAVQLLTCIHVVRSRRDTFWIIFILMAPWLGAAVYFFTQVLPELRHSRAARQIKTDVSKLVDPDRDYQQALRALEEVDSVENKLRVARHLIARHEFDDAVALYESALSGIYADDPQLLLEYAGVEFQRNAAERSLSLLDRIQQAHPDYQSEVAHLLYARALESLGRNDEALDSYAALVEYASGEEARCRYALLLQKLGHVDDAKREFARVVYNVERASKVYFRNERDWYQVAKRNL